MSIKIEMICTGEEVLSGQIIDTNGPWFANTLMDHGLELQQRLVVGDRMDDLITAFLERSTKADVILVNGGLGPTSDDLSAEAMARALQEPLREDAGWREHLEQWFSARGRQMPLSNIKQCLLPQSAELIDNPQGSAPGFRVRLGTCWFIFTPGPPGEFHPMVHDHVLPFIQTAFAEQSSTRLHKLLTLGHGESILADTLAQLTLPEGLTLGYRSSMPHVEIKVFARGNEAVMRFDETVQTIRECLGPAVVTENRSGIAEEVHHLLLQQGAQLSLAESCSGGMLSALLVDFPGSSAYLQQAVVSYSNAAKELLLGVPADTLALHGAVSTETAIAMAKGAQRIQDSDYALAITGVAGPDGGTEEKPIGRVCIALVDREAHWVQSVQLSRRSRHMVRLMSCAVALDMLRRRLQQLPPIADYPFIPRQS